MLSFSEIQSFKKQLIKLWQPETERCGIILPDGEVVETANLAEDTTDRFELPREELDRAIASWHTHPKSTGNLSLADFYFFKSWPNLSHFIVDRNSVWCYLTENGRVLTIDAETDHPSRPSG